MHRSCAGDVEEVPVEAGQIVVRVGAGHDDLVKFQTLCELDRGDDYAASELFTVGREKCKIIVRFTELLIEAGGFPGRLQNNRKG